jgi:hypothetical protein
MCACVLPPLSRIARRALKARVKTLAGAFGHAPARRLRPHSPPCLNEYNRTEIQWRTFSFIPTHVCDSTHTLVFNWLNN